MEEGRRYLLFALLVFIIISIIGVAYAHSTDSLFRDIDNDGTWEEHMDEMHEIMTKGLDKETREAMDEMHEGCIGR